MKNRIIVVGAAIVKDGQVLALRRADGIDEVKHKFEFVGGKVEEGETPQEALIRECREELSLEIEVGDLLNKIDYEYPNISVCLSVYFVKLLSGFELKEHEEARWIDYRALDTVEWAPADRAFLNSIKNGFVKFRQVSTSEDISIISKLAAAVVSEIYLKLTSADFTNYVLNTLFSPESIADRINSKKFEYLIVNLNGEDVGFFAYSNASDCELGVTEGTYISHMYLKEFARNKQIAAKFISNLPYPVYLKINRDNIEAVNILKHGGFKILQTITTDFGNGYTSDDFLMVLN